MTQTHRIVRLIALFALLATAEARPQDPGGKPRPLHDRWRPSPELIAEAASLVVDEARHDWLLPIEEGDPLAYRKVEVLRAGLRLPDGPAAVACASALEPVHLDAWESARVVELLLPRAFTPETTIDFDERLRWIMGSTDIPALFNAMPAGQPWSRNIQLGKIHVIMRSHHARLGARWIGTEDLRIRGVASSAIWAAIGYDDRFREEIAEALLDLAGREGEAASRTRGLPSHLVEILRWVHRDGFEKDCEQLGLPEFPRHLPGWSLRWLADEIPGTRDEELLLWLLARVANAKVRGLDDSTGQSVVLRALGYLKGDHGLAALEAADPAVDPFAAAAMFQRGRHEHLESLVARVGIHEAALPLLLQLAPTVAREHISRAFRGNAPERRAMLSALAELDYATRAYRIRWDRQSLQPLHQELAAQAGDAPLAACAFALLLPGCATRGLAEAAMEAMLDDDTQSERSAVDFSEGAASFPSRISTFPSDIGERVIGFLDATRPEQLRKMLRRWSDSETPVVRRFARETLLRLGDPASGPLLVEYIEGIKDSEDWKPIATLARSASPKVNAYVREGYTKGDCDLATLAICRGLDVRAEFTFRQAVDWVEDVDRMARIEALVLAGNPVGALAEAMESYPLEEAPNLSNIGIIRDARIAEWLRGVQIRRESGQYAWATGQLSLMGSADDRAETWSVLRDGRYGWLTELDDIVVTNGYDAATMGYWIDELRSQCCRIAMGESAVGRNLLDDELSWFSGAEGAGMTPYEWAARHWRPDATRRLVWSDFLYRFIMVYE